MSRTRGPGSRAKSCGRRLGNRLAHPQAGRRPGAAQPRGEPQGQPPARHPRCPARPVPPPGDSPPPARVQLQAPHRGQRAANLASRPGRSMPGQEQSLAGWALPVQPGHRRAVPGRLLDCPARSQFRLDRQARPGRGPPNSPAAHRKATRSEAPPHPRPASRTAPLATWMKLARAPRSMTSPVQEAPTTASAPIRPQRRCCFLGQRPRR